jgi:hypothetical protein
MARELKCRQLLCPQEAMLKSLITAILDLSKPLALVIALFCVDATVLSVALPTQLHKK